MEQQLRDKSETFKIIYKALLSKIIYIYIYIYISAILLACIAVCVYLFLSHASIVSIAASEWITHLDVTSKTLQHVTGRRSS